GPKNLGLDAEEIDKRVRDAIKIVGLDYDEIADKSPFELSGGQKRRVAIAGVVAMEPKILILDEPTAGLDPTAHKEIISMIESIRKKLGIIIIFVSHNMADVAALSDKVLVVNNAKIAAEGTPGEVFSRVDFLREIGLDVPPAVEIMKALESRIDGFTSKALTLDEAADEVVKLVK
ncbi:MAG: ATP-binding cassette domain-containing protein, partial [Mogibacterium sp.]|nr:ATP-binding cassette domain-containing protein [Mogibacterium sp.]